uniref:Uncharacterized protein n=1 Tax=Candidatus Kentrum sp. DK TaxID=2126562 RepID=A0A450T9E3_9GAMM|nr:MAG: hypothetical protein BECKDK2373C_GA0170839_11061 [Candidatus Kentron sp. DK]
MADSDDRTISRSISARSLSDLGVRREGKRDRDQNLCKFEANSELFNENLRGFWPISAFPQQNRPKSDRLLGNSSSELDTAARMFGPDPKPKTNPQKPKRKRVSTEYTAITEKSLSGFGVLGPLWLEREFLVFAAPGKARYVLRGGSPRRGRCTDAALKGRNPTPNHIQNVGLRHFGLIAEIPNPTYALSQWVSVYLGAVGLATCTPYRALGSWQSIVSDTSKMV